MKFAVGWRSRKPTVWRRAFALIATHGALLSSAPACASCSESAPGTQDASLDSRQVGDVRSEDAVAAPRAEPGWRFMTEVAPNCYGTEIALDPIAAAPEYKWVSCATLNPRCSRLATTGFRQDPGPRIFGAANASQNGSFLSIGHFVRYDIGIVETDLVSVPDMGKLGAWRSGFVDDPCSVGPALGQTQGMMIELNPVYRFAKGPIASLKSLTSFAPLSPDPSLAPNVTETVAMSDITVALDQQPGHLALRLPLASTSWVRNQGNDLSVPFVVNDDVFVFQEHGPDGWSREMRLDNDGSITLYYARPKHDVMAFASDGKTMFWIDAYGLSDPTNLAQPNIEVWAAPFTRDPLVLATNAQKLSTLSLPQAPPDGLAQNGYYALGGGDHKVYIFRADGAAQVLDLPTIVGPNSYMQKPAIVNDTELWGVVSEYPGAFGVGFARVTLGPWP